MAPTGLPLLEERGHEAHRVPVRPQDVRVDHAARQDEPVVLRRVGVLHGRVDRERVGLVVVVEPLDLAALERDQLRGAAGLLDGLPGLSQLDLLDPVRGEEGDALALQLGTHVVKPPRWMWCARTRSAYPRESGANSGAS